MLKKLIRYIGKLISEGFTGKIILSFHKGSVTKKVHREITEEI